jgi:hypothetical protein
MAGRAGRRGIESEGLVIPIANPATICSYYSQVEQPHQLELKGQPTDIDLLALHYVPPAPGRVFSRVESIGINMQQRMQESVRRRATTLQRTLHEITTDHYLYCGYLTHRLMHTLLDLEDPRMLYWFELLRQGQLHNANNPKRLLWVICYLWSTPRTTPGPTLLDPQWSDAPLIHSCQLIQHHRFFAPLPTNPDPDVYTYLSQGFPPIQPQRLPALQEAEQALSILLRLTQNHAPPEDQLLQVFQRLNHEIISNQSSTTFISVETAGELNTA